MSNATSTDLGSFVVGDIYAGPVVLNIEVDTAEFTACTVVAVSPTNTVVPLDSLIDATNDRVLAYFPDNYAFPTSGVWTVRLTMVDVDGGTNRFDSVHFVVEADDGWHSLAGARAAWPNHLSDVALYGLLQVSREQCEDYAPAYTPSTRPPLRYLQAQLMQARNLNNAFLTNPSDTDPDGFTLRPFPMDNTVKNILRPKRGLGTFGGVQR